MSDQWLTPRLVARRPLPDDRAGYRSVFLDPAVAEWLSPSPLLPMNEADVIGLHAADVSHWVEHGFGPCALIDRESGSFVGRGGLRWTYVSEERRVELPWTISPDRWGEGFATEAASAAVDWARGSDLKEIVALILPANRPSRRVAEKIGMQSVGETQHAGLAHLLYSLSVSV